MTPGNAFGILIVLTGGASLLIVTLATAAAVVRSFRPDQPEPPAPAAPAPAHDDSDWWIEPTYIQDLRGLLTAHAVTDIVARRRIGARG